MDTKHKVYNLIILDESGSMASIKDTIISGFNEIVQTVKGVALEFPEQEHLISLVSFSGFGIKPHLENVEVSKLDEIDGSKYKPGGSTPLYDAMGESIHKLRQITEETSPCNVLVTILTDGEENSSREYTGAAIKKTIEELKQKNWTFTYIGANHSVENFAISLSITNTMKFETNEADMKRMFKQEKLSRRNYSASIRQKKNTTDNYYGKGSEEKT